MNEPSILRDERDQRFERLVEGERRFVHRLANGESDQEIASSIGANSSQIQAAVKLVAKKVLKEYRQEAPYEEIRQALVQESKIFFKIADPQPKPVADSDQQGQRVEEDLPIAEETSSDPVPEAQPESFGVKVSEPAKISIEEVARHIGLDCTERVREVLKIFAYAASSHEEATAASKLGMQPLSMRSIISQASKKLGLDKIFPVESRKPYLRQAFEQYPELVSAERIVARGHQARIARAQRQQQVPPPPAPAPAPVVAVAKVNGAVADAAPARQPEQIHPPAAPSESLKKERDQTLGAGVVIPLPADVSNIDVVAGTFTNRVPSPALAESIRQRKANGLKLAYVVLYPSTSEPDTAHAHLVFLQRG